MGEFREEVQAENGEVALPDPDRPAADGLGADPWPGLRWQPPVVGVQTELWALGWGCGKLSKRPPKSEVPSFMEGVLCLSSPHNGASDLSS